MRVTRWTDVAIWDAIDRHARDAASWLAVAAECEGTIRERLTRRAVPHARAFARLRDAAFAESTRRWRERAA